MDERLATPSVYSLETRRGTGGCSGHLSEVMEAPLGGEGDEHDEGADRRDDPRRRELQRLCLHLPTGIPHLRPLAAAGAALTSAAKWQS